MNWAAFLVIVILSLAKAAQWQWGAHLFHKAAEAYWRHDTAIGDEFYRRAVWHGRFPFVTRRRGAS